MYLVGISTDPCKLVSFDIPTGDNIHHYQRDNPISSVILHVRLENRQNSARKKMDVSPQNQGLLELEIRIRKQVVFL